MRTNFHELLNIFERTAKYSKQQLFEAFIAYSVSKVYPGYIDGGKYERINLLDNLMKDFPNELLDSMYHLMYKDFKINPYQDYLGELYMRLNMGNAKIGQFFTPYSISKLMAQINIGNLIVPTPNIQRIYDPTCGSGSLLIAYAEVIKRSQCVTDNYLFYAQDISLISGLMCYIQLTTLNLHGFIKIVDTLSQGFLNSDEKDDGNVWMLPNTKL